MKKCSKTFTITEYGGFTRGCNAAGYQALPEKTFDALELFILENSSNRELREDTQAGELLCISSKRSVGKIITAKNYVGVITMKDGTVIEILPKIAGKGVTVAETKRAFLSMLRSIHDISFKNMDVASLNTENLDIFEIFIGMFLNEVLVLTKQGLKQSYVPIENNEHFYKGKLLSGLNLKHNLINKGRFYIQYDEFNLNRSENRLIKTTLCFIQKATRDGKHRQLANRLLGHFDGVQKSCNYSNDFAKCCNDRSMSHYAKALSWCRVFLFGNSFTSFSGSSISLALLFPMETVFEKCIAEVVKKSIGNVFHCRVQDNRYNLFDSPRPSFALRPDIVLEKGKRVFVIDTKWKLLSNEYFNKGISQSDMYQMYVYGKKYNASSVTLLYPYSDLITDSGFEYCSTDNVKVDVFFVNLLEISNSIQDLLEKFFTFG